MRREYASIAAMGAILVGSQVIAILLAPLFLTGGFQAFPNPSDVTNTAVYIVLILAFTGVILLLVRFRRQNVAKYVILASIFVTLAFIFLLPLYVGLYYATGQPVDDNQLAFLANLSTLLSFVIAGGLIYVLVKFPEWYVVDTVGIVTAAGVTAILGISFGILPAEERVLHSAEREVGHRGRNADVDPDVPGAHAGPEVPGVLAARRVDRRRIPIRTAVDRLDRLLEALRLKQARDRPEDFLPGDAHFGPDGVED